MDEVRKPFNSILNVAQLHFELYAIKTYGGVDVQIYIFLTSALAGGEWSLSRPCLFTPRGKSSRYPLSRKLGGPQSRSRRRGEEKILHSNSDPSVVQPVASRYTDYAVQVLFLFGL
jgi:hypothetical protein